MKDAGLGRSEREQLAYDEGEIWRQCNRWHARAHHVLECPNTRRHERLFDELTARYAEGRRALDIGCGDGHLCRKLRSLGASHVLGMDISAKHIAEAAATAVPGEMEFLQGDVTRPIGGRYHLITGRSILHHIDYRPVLRRLFDENLSGGGAMVFMEPLGSNVLGFLYQRLSRAAHTADERPFKRRDLKWFRDHFERVAVYPYNYFSYPLGVVSSFLCKRPDNLVLRACDRADCWLARHATFLEPRFRQAILFIEKRTPPATVA